MSMNMLKIIIFIIMSLISVAFLTLLERKVLSLVGLRLGPLKVSILGLMQPLYDALKISQKQTNIFSNVSFFFYYLSCLIMLILSVTIWFISPFYFKLVDLKFSLLIFFLILSFHTIKVIFSGWSIFSKFSVLSVLRLVSQLISYELIIFMVMFFFLLFYNSFNFFYYGNNMNFIFMPVVFFFWLYSILCELSRTPFDYAESESELVSGFNIDFGSKIFSLIFMSEYSNIFFMSFLTSFIFFFKNFILLNVIMVFLYFFIIWVRGVFPRMRYDENLYLCWKFMFPFLIFIFIVFILFF